MFMKGMHSFIVLSPPPASTTPRASAISQCKARYPMPTVPPGIFGCRIGWVSIGRVVSKMGSMPCLFCQTVRPYGQDFWVDLFPMDAWCLAPTMHKYCTIGQRSERQSKFNGSLPLFLWLKFITLFFY